ncbi:MAG TPA: MBL fold metallo-hydrolase [Vicinamibacterales bacterium]|nr:MBL fold metallo-hydrolase [Vicinamibacterales bacterium]
MKRVALLVVLVAAGGLSVALSARQGADKPKVVEVEKLKDNLYVLKGGGGNTAVFVTSKGVVVVDTKNPGWGAPLIAKIRELTDKPITTIINTHTHGDHVSGNVEFEPTVDVITHANTAENMKKMLMPSGFKPSEAKQTIFEQNGGRGLPKRWFTTAWTMGSGKDQVDIRYFGRGHTNGDAWVIFPALRVMHAGDIFSGKNVPILDANNGGSGVDMPATLTKAADYAKKVDAIITGHSTQMTVADLREYAAFNLDFLNAVREGKKAGKSADEIAAAWTIPAKYTGYAAPQPDRLKSNVEVVLAELK